MSLRPKELSLVCGELNQLLAGAFAQKAWAPSKRRCYLEFRQPGRSVLLLISLEQDVARLAVVPARVTAEVPSGFQKWLRQELIGAQLEAAEAMGRLVRLRFRTREGDRALIADFATDVLLLTGKENRILAVSSEAPTKLAAGQEYELPELSSDETPSRLQPIEGAAFPYAEAAEALHAGTDQKRRLGEAKRLLLQPLKTKRTRLLRTLEKVREEANRTEQAEAHRRHGELLAQNLFKVPKGAKSVKLTEYTAEGVTEVEVPLDPKLPPKEQPERHFHQYRRLLRGVEHATARLQQLEAELGELDTELNRLQSLDEEALLNEPLNQQPSGTRREAPGRHVPYRTYFAKSGARILVGKTAADNDELTFKLARPYDLWLHARGVPGSHVIVPLERNAEVPQEVLLDAAHLALHYSPYKGEPRAEVAYTSAKFVRKQKDGPPGAVIYTREKVFMVRVEPERLARLLSTTQS